MEKKASFILSNCLTFYIQMKFKLTIDAANETIRLMNDLCESETVLAEIERIVDLIVNSFKEGGKVLLLSHKLC